MYRKTINVEKIRTMVNKSNLQVYGCREHRQGHNALLESILQCTGNYNGYCHLDEDDLPSGVAPGIIFDGSGKLNHIFPDDSRRRYL